MTSKKASTLTIGIIFSIVVVAIILVTFFGAAQLFVGLSKEARAGDAFAFVINGLCEGSVSDSETIIQEVPFSKGVSGEHKIEIYYKITLDTSEEPYKNHLHLRNKGYDKAGTFWSESYDRTVKKYYLSSCDNIGVYNEDNQPISFSSSEGSEYIQLKITKTSDTTVEVIQL